MGEEEKKPEGKEEEEKKGKEEKKPAEEGKKEEVKEKKEEKTEEKGDGKEKEKVKEKGDGKEKEEAAPSEEIVLMVYMHCEGCARKVRRCLKGFEGVEDVQTDCKTHKVVVKGKKADPLKVLERVQKKSHRKVELLTPIPKPPVVEEKKPEVKKEEEKPKVEEKKEEPPVIVVVLKVHMHCEACAQDIKKTIMKMKGVQAADPELKSSQVTVKGVFEPAKLVEYLYKRGKHAVIVKEELEKKAEDKPKEGDEKKDVKDDGGKDGKDAGNEEKKDGKDGGAEGKGGDDGKEEVKTELLKNDYYSTRYYTEYVYAPEIFSDENPNACSVM